MTAGTATTATERRSTTPTVGGPAVLVVAYVIAMPFLAGLPRGALIPVLRPSEALQLAVTGAGAVMVGLAMVDGRRWRIRIRPLEWWLLAATVTASIVPLLWLLARAEPVGRDELLAAFPLVKYSALYLLARVAVRTETELAAVVAAATGTAAAIATISVAQAMSIGPVVDVLTRFFVSSADDVVDGGRGTTTIGSSIATGAYLSIACGIALSWGLATARRRWLGVAALLGFGALASGQAGTVVALAVVALVVAHCHGRSAQLLGWSLPVALVGIAGLWSIVSARLTDLDPGTGLPASWIIRWNNISELYLPALSDRGWILGVSPDVVVQPADVWRSVVYLESGYLWLLWVGGLPLLVAVLGLFASAWRALAPEPASSEREAALGLGATRIAGRAAVAMLVVLSVIDPHLTLRGGADLFFVVLALGLVAEPLARALPSAPHRWRRLLVIAPDGVHHTGARLQLAEAPAGRAGRQAEVELRILARADDRDIGTTRLGLYRTPAGLRGVVVEPVHGVDGEARALVWRALALIAGSLRLRDLRVHPYDARNGDERSPIERRELRRAARLAERLEIDRLAGVADQEIGAPGRARRDGGSAHRGDEDRLPAVRLDPGLRAPRWKRLADLVVGIPMLVLSAPLWLIVAWLVRRSGPGPILYRQVRIGMGGLPFQIHKFRSMYVGNDDSAHRAQNRLELRGQASGAKDDDDPRITPVGRWLRRLSLDELPQLVNIVRAEMSLVGPRPSLLWECELFEPAARRRLTARPGLTGLWQTSGRADLSMSEMLELDLVYVDRISPTVDLRCLVRTAGSVVAREGAV